MVPTPLSWFGASQSEFDEVKTLFTFSAELGCIPVNFQNESTNGGKVLLNKPATNTFNRITKHYKTKPNLKTNNTRIRRPKTTSLVDQNQIKVNSNVSNNFTKPDTSIMEVTSDINAATIEIIQTAENTVNISDNVEDALLNIFLEEDKSMEILLEQSQFLVEPVCPTIKFPELDEIIPDPKDLFVMAEQTDIDDGYDTNSEKSYPTLASINMGMDMETIMSDAANTEFTLLGDEPLNSLDGSDPEDVSDPDWNIVGSFDNVQDLLTNFGNDYPLTKKTGSRHTKGPKPQPLHILPAQNRDNVVRCREYRKKKNEIMYKGMSELEELEKRNIDLKQRETKMRKNLAHIRSSYLRLIKEGKIKFC